MKSALYWGLLSVLIIAGTVTALWPRTTESPIADQSFNAGPVKGGSKLVHAFEGRNTGSQVAKLELYSTGCSCTVAGNLPMEVPPGGTFRIPVEISVHDEPGRYGWRVVLRENGHRFVSYSVVADVIRVAPSRISFGRTLRGNAEPIRFNVQPIDLKQVTVRKIIADSRYFTVIRRKSESVAGAVEIAVQLSPEIPFGGFSKMLALFTDDPDAPQIIIDVSGYVLKPVEVVEPVCFDFVKEGSDVSASARLRLPYGGTVKFDHVEATTSEQWTVRLNEMSNDGDNLVVPVTYHAENIAGAFSGRITLTGSVGALPFAVDIPYSGYCEAP